MARVSSPQIAASKGLRRHSPFDAYEALSYTWGDADITVPILLHGIPHPVTINLELALRHIRYEDRPRIMWIDALCINQKDISEKNHQVAQMREIFLDAEQVVVWLGEEGTAQSAINLCKLLEERNNPLSKEEFTQHSEEFQACDDLFNKRPWWRRTWIVQEVYHTNPVEVYIGRLRIGLDTIAEMWTLYFTNVLERQKLSGNIYDITPLSILQPIYIISRERQRLKERDTEPYTLSVLIGMFREQEASDPRDKLFALVGISSERDCFDANYNLPCRDVYVNVTRKLLANTLYPLLQVEALNRSLPSKELPSWVPDYSSRQRSMARTMNLCSSKFVAAPPKKEWTLLDWSINEAEGDGIFCLYGAYVAIVTGVFTRQTGQFDGDEEDLTWIRFDEDPGKRNCVLDFEDWKFDPSENRIFDTGWGPYETNIGDIVVVAEGSPVPLVLRKDGKFFLLVGPCWLFVGEVEADSWSEIMFGQDPRVFGAKTGYPSSKKHPGFSDIMWGRVWGNPSYFDQSESIWETAREEFRLR
jgi:hypothetical protein